MGAGQFLEKMDKPRLSSTQTDIHRKYDQQEPILANSRKDNAIYVMTSSSHHRTFCSSLIKKRIIDKKFYYLNKCSFSDAVQKYESVHKQCESVHKQCESVHKQCESVYLQQLNDTD